MWSSEVVHLRTADQIALYAQYYAAPGATLHCVLGHGFTGSSSQPRVRIIAETLCETGVSVLSLDFRGHGRSAGRSTVGVSEVADVEAAVAWLRRRRPRVPIVTLGFSMGASIVVRHAGLGGRVDAVVAVSGPGRWYERGTEPMRLVHRGVETRLGRAALRYGFRTRVGGGWDLLPVAPVEVAPAIAVPLLVVHGDADPYFDLAHPRMLAAAAPRSQLWIEAGMGHAENAVDRALTGRLEAWMRAAVGESGTMTR